MARVQATTSTLQLGLPFISYDTPETLRASLEREVGRTLSLVLTENVRSLLSLRPGREGIPQVRLHKMFLQAPQDVLAELGRYIKNPRAGRTPLFWRFVQGNTHLIAQPTARRTAMRTSGKFHDLAEMFDNINREQFGGRLKCGVTWGHGARGRVKRRTLGSYSTASDTIRINSVLDRKDVPSYYVGFVLYHEMLHADMGIGELGGRRLVHPREFKERERLYTHYERAMTYEGRPR